MWPSKEDMEKWATIWAPVAAFFGFLWHKVNKLSAAWDGFKLDYDKANKALGKAEGELAGRDYVHDRDRKEKEEDRDK